MSETISVQVNGKELEVPVGITVAAAVYRAGQISFRTSVTGEPRAPLCGMGICLECRVDIDGTPNRRSCQTAVQDGMVIQTS